MLALAPENRHQQLRSGIGDGGQPGAGALAHLEEVVDAQYLLHRIQAALRVMGDP
ncbi:hypothetical protein D3C78_1959710 [compost metagenome]